MVTAKSSLAVADWVPAAVVMLDSARAARGAAMTAASRLTDSSFFHVASLVNISFKKT